LCDLESSKCVETAKDFKVLFDLRLKRGKNKPISSNFMDAGAKLVVLAELIVERIFMKFLIAVVALVLSSLPSFGAEIEFKTDSAHTNINFEVDHLVVSTVTGKFSQFEGKFFIDDKGNLIRVEGVIQAKSIDTGNQKRDEHLRSKDFFDVEKFKTLNFVSDPLKIAPNKKSSMTGVLTIHGVSKPVKWDIKYRGQVTDPWGNEKAAFKAGLTINRKDYGLNWNEALEAGGVLVGDEIQIELNVEGDKVELPAKTEEKKAQK